MTDYSANNKTISNKVTEEYKSTYKNNVIVVSFSSFIRETTQRILPYSPQSNH